MNNPKVVVSTKQRPSVEVVEYGDGEFAPIAMVYGRTIEEAKARAELIRQWMSIEGTLPYIRRRLKQISWYHWAHSMHKQHKRPYNIFTLLTWLLGCIVDPEQVGKWLHATFDTSDPFARPMSREEVSLGD